MKIGIDARMYASSFTGIGRYTYELIQHLLALDGKNEYVIFLRKIEFARFKCPNPRVKKVLADFAHYSFGEQLGFLRVLNREKPDLMHFTHFNAPIFYRRPFVVTIHDLTLSRFPGKKMTRLFHRWAYQLTIRRVTRRARTIIAVSEHTKADLRSLLKVPASKIKVVYHGIDAAFGQVSKAAARQAKAHYHLQQPYFLYTGVWRDHKNVTGMIQAFARFARHHQGLFDLVITGKEDPHYPEVREAVQRFNLQNRVRFTGLVSDADLTCLYQGAFAYVFPSFYEGFGFPPLEAMRAGVPVLASRTSSIPEVCGEGNALFFDPHRVDDMARAMTRMALDSDLRVTLVARGKAHVKRFKWDIMARQTLAIYHASFP